MNWKKIGDAIKNGFVAMLHGELLLRLRFDKYFPHIIYTFFLMWMMIWLSMKIENTMVKVEKNKTTLNDMKIYHAQKTVEVVSLDRISTVEDLLQKSGSDVELPVRPADRIIK
ncbi:MAG: hypothetical protein IJ202_03255 [Bacteroidales bacterium]|jgi:hypothetical protein|nr:hypothetical protein [Bacteroidales bacterium]MBQ9173842.1 hypothetical protein [Bacteroidales bacterium]MBQ9710794.1 hypothetical protein [Bacteroidales bacterium]MBR6414909.1 hypothetical protein [Bacteroidales bacterium]